MTKTFSDLLESNSNVAFTENGAISNQSTLDSVLNLFASGGASRTKSPKDRYNMIEFALGENFELGLRALFYLGDVRGGQGERDLFKIGLKVLADHYPNALVSLVDLIPEFGRWDYLYELKGTVAENAMVALLRKTHEDCVANNTTSLMYKWIKSPNTSSKVSRELGRWTANVLGFGKEYKGIHEFQKLLATKRAQLGDVVVETKMSSGKFSTIDYSKVASKASLRYRNAFLVRDTARYEAFNVKVEKGEAKINAGTLYPHEIVSAYRGKSVDSTLENLWNALPNYINSDERVMVVGDMSGSMECQGISPKSNLQPIDVARALCIYTAQRLQGAFKNKAILFSSRAQYMNFDRCGSSLASYLQYIRQFDDCSTTNLQSVFDLILETAIANKVDESELPTKVLVVSDMEFNPTYQNATNLEVVKAKYARSGYKMPQLVFWNVASRNNQFPATKFDKGVAMVSGYSPSLLVDILAGEIINPITSMLKTLNKPRYDVVVERTRGAK